MKLLFSSICIIIAFFFGYNYAEQKNVVFRESYQNEQYFVNITIKKNKLSIDKNSENIQVLINGEYLGSELTLENVCN